MEKNSKIKLAPFDHSKDAVKNKVTLGLIIEDNFDKNFIRIRIDDHLAKLKSEYQVFVDQIISGANPYCALEQNKPKCL